MTEPSLAEWAWNSYREYGNRGSHSFTSSTETFTRDVSFWKKYSLI